MSQTDALKRYLEAGMAFTQLTRKRAEQVVKDLVTAGDLQRSQAKEAIDELVDRSRKNTDVLAEQVRREVDSQLSNMGLARKADVERLEAEVERLKGSEAGKPAEPTRKAPAKAAPAKKVAADKAVGGMAPVSGGLPGASAARSNDKPAPAKKAPAKKAGAEKATADQAPVSGELPAKRVAKAAKKRG